MKVSQDGPPVDRMANGNTVIACWIAGDSDTSHWPGTVQVLEVTSKKLLVSLAMEGKFAREMAINCAAQPTSDSVLSGNASLSSSPAPQSCQWKR
jgi:hypothetical protein